jgi:hypothetical protein
MRAREGNQAGASKRDGMQGSKNKHATKHFHRSKHPIMQSVEPGEDWRWCYVDEIEV